MIIAGWIRTVARSTVGLTKWLSTCCTISATRPAQAAVCHHYLRLPMRGRATSLNLAVAAGVMLYAMLEGGS